MNASEIKIKSSVDKSGFVSQLTIQLIILGLSKDYSSFISEITIHKAARNTQQYWSKHPYWILEGLLSGAFGIASFLKKRK
ncbi:hypothetical protein [Bartonella sp. MM73XJBT.G]|uniref:hypothetical protein n=1 Tax=Bartonella sp. MM73XJBT.G TaxID=3019097 RepID=UPI00235F06B2|nr:hypothetical protein [Bartonella sp. MM73XJBT.G]